MRPAWWLALAGAVLSAPAAQGACQPARFKVAVDVGHHRAAPGATSAGGASEFTYNLRLAETVSAALAGAGFSARFLIGGSGNPIALEERTRQAVAAGAALFLSLHHDSVQPHYLSTWQVGGADQRYSDRFRGFSVFVSDLNRQARESRAFGAMLGEALLARGMTPSLHHAEPIPGENRPLLDARLGLYRFDGLAVLRTATMPAVLLEAAVIVNRDEEAQVRSGLVASRVAAAAVQAVREFCAGLPG